MSAGWRLSEEGFLKDRGALSDLKLRGSWAKTGNQNFGNYRQYTTYLFGNNQAQVQFGNTYIPTIRPSAVDPNIKWEATDAYNVGLDFGFWNDRLTGSLDWYTKNTSDMLFEVPAAAGTNLSNFVITNIGSMKNSGFEMAFNYRVLEGNPSRLGWSFGLNASHNKNELLEINPIATSARAESRGQHALRQAPPTSQRRLQWRESCTLAEEPSLAGTLSCRTASEVGFRPTGRFAPCCSARMPSLMSRHDATVIPTAPSEIDDLCEVAEVSHITKGGRKSSRDPVVREIPLTIFLNAQEIVTLLCTGAHVESLAVGFLNSEGLLQDRGSLRSVEVDQTRHIVRVSSSEDAGFAERLLGRRIITSGCGKGTIFYHVLDSLQSRPVEHRVSLQAEQVRHLMGELNRRSELYRRSRGVHNCAFALPEEIILFRADIGRHNAVDMIIGECFLGGVATQDKILLTTGRITSEILIKCAKAGIPALVSRSAATCLALQLARELKMTVIGYVRGGNMTVYAGGEHIEA